MKLIDILARELEEWPSDAITINQDKDGVWANLSELPNDTTSGGNWIPGGLNGIDCEDDYLEIADDWETATVTRSEWEAARAAYLTGKQMKEDIERDLSEIQFKLIEPEDRSQFFIELTAHHEQESMKAKDLKAEPSLQEKAFALDKMQKITESEYREEIEQIRLESLAESLDVVANCHTHMLGMMSTK